MFSPKYKAFTSAYRGDLEQHLKSVKAIDSHTVEFVTKGVYAPFLIADCTLGLLPKHVLGSLSPKALNTAPFNQGPTVSNGVFKYVSRKQGSSITLRPEPELLGRPVEARRVRDEDRARPRSASRSS